MQIQFILKEHLNTALLKPDEITAIKYQFKKKKEDELRYNEILFMPGCSPFLTEKPCSAIISLLILA